MTPKTHRRSSDPKRAPSREIQAVRLTPRALRACRRGGEWRILHVFDRVCNLVDTGGAVLSVGVRARDLAPFGILIASHPDGDSWPPFRDWLEERSAVAMQPGVIHMGFRAIRLRGGKIWSPRPDWHRLRRRRREIATHLPALRRHLRRHAPAGGLARLAAGSAAELGRDRGARAERPIDRALAELAGPHIRLLRSGLRTGELDSVRSGAQGLAGLGGGLTPAGDDFLAGAVLALHMIRSEGRATCYGRAIAEVAAPRTSPFSRAWLRAAAEGEAAAEWHPLLEALSRLNQRDALEAMDGLLRVGHTSGGDALGGFQMVLGLLKCAGKRCQGKDDDISL